ncbi:MAG TPA: hypothetical protein VJ044_14300, partial [Candidatus Hodarchaeales archaeon]|nr:hypothetical protein [Candidatus Hodarchaeales archaeon]
KDFQSALRRTMEKSPHIRFIYILNVGGTLIPAIESRCANFRFTPLPPDLVLRKINEITDKEGIKMTADAKQLLLSQSRGDLRKLINLVQSASVLFEGSEIDVTAVEDILGIAKKKDLAELFSILSSKGNDGLMKASQKLRFLLKYQGIPPLALLRQIHELVDENSAIQDLHKVKVAEAVGDAEFRLIHDSNSEIQLLFVLSRIRSSFLAT